MILAGFKGHLFVIVKRHPLTAPLYKAVFFLRYSAYFRKILRNIHRPAFWLRLWRWHAFDLRHGTDTQFPVEPHQYDLNKSQLQDCTMYRGSSPELFSTALALLPVEAGQWVFLDIGSGKGRVLLLASSLPFRQIIGVEFSPRLHAIAVRNIQIYHSREQRCRAIVPVLGDALTFEFPEEKTIIYLYNPFGEESVRTFVARLEESWRRAPRRMIVLYMVPKYAAVFAEAGFLRERTQEWLTGTSEAAVLRQQFGIWESVETGGVRDEVPKKPTRGP